MDNMRRLNLPEPEVSVIAEQGEYKILDIIRKKYVALTPEEWVRQHVIHYFKSTLEVPPTLMAVEKSFRIGQMTKRFDVAVYNNEGTPLLLTECKSPDVSVSQKVFDQALRYNMHLHVDYLFVTNGLEHYGGKIDYRNQTFRFIKKLPKYQDMIENRGG